MKVIVSSYLNYIVTVHDCSLDRDYGRLREYAILLTNRECCNYALSTLLITINTVVIVDFSLGVVLAS